MSELYTYCLKTIITWQSFLNEMISASIGNTHNTPVASSLAVLGIAFLYGLIHAAGPGHAKAMIASYMIVRGWSGAKKAAFLGFSVAAVHALSALILTFGIYFLMERFSDHFSQSSALLQKSSAVMIVLVGLYLLYEAFFPKASRESHGRKDIFAVFAAGSVPCPGVMTITLFALTLGHYSLALFSAIAMSLGMGLTIFASALIAGALRHKSTLFFPKWEQRYAVIGALAVIGLGLLLAIGSFVQAPPHRPF